MVRDVLVRLCLWLCAALPAWTAAPPAWEEAPGHRRFPVHPAPGTRPGFTRIPGEAAGLLFTNQLAGDAYLTNAVAHNGAGVAIGDVDADGWPDVYLCSLEGPNRLYRNLGGWKFAEIPAGEAACATQFSTGAAFADLDGDGDLDLLVNGIAAGTRLFLNNGQGGLTEAKDTGLSRTASATSLAIADIDRDGDLDLYCPHFIDVMMLSDPTTRFAVMRRGNTWEVSKVNGESAKSPRWQGRFEALPDGRVRELPEVHGLYRNEGGGRFKALEHEPGTYLDERGQPIPPFRDWGLAAMFRDLNGDGFPDLYVCNDNTSPDRVWINTGRGTFRALETVKLRHTSRSSMGVDFGDVNRDGRDDFFVVDMLARDPMRRKRQLMRDRPDLADLESGETRPQFNRNTLFFGRADGFFVEAAFLAGVAATDWTWSSILLDVDLDGYEDLLVTNGFEFDVMDQDSQNEIKLGRRKYTEAQLKRSLQFHPAWRTRNAAFRNRGDGTFEPAPQWGFEDAGVSFGAALGDLDNDGDLDLVVNNLNAPAGLYRNEAAAPRVGVRLRGKLPNGQGIGARVELAGGPVTQAQEIMAGGRYLSGDQAGRVFAAGSTNGGALSLRVRWPDGARTILTNVQADRVYEIQEPAGAVPEPPAVEKVAPPLLENVSGWLGHGHVDAAFDDWARQPLLPKRLSRLGPGVAWHDFDGDGWEDLAVSGGRGGQLSILRNREGRTFEPRAGEVLAGDQGAVVGWPDGQGARKLLVAGSAHELPPGGRATLEIHAATPGNPPERLDLGDINPGPLALGDVDGDGDLDVFLGGRFRTGRYPEPVASTLWRNDGGRLVPDATRGEALQKLGLAAGATFADLDGDGRAELVVALEWGPIRVFRSAGEKLEDVTRAWGLESLTGWWTGVTAGDFDGDGRVDLAAGNWGRNTVYELSQPAVFRVFYGEWNGDGAVQLLETWRPAASGTSDWYPFQDRAWLDRGLPRLAEQFPTHEAFGKAGLRDILGSQVGTTAFLEAVRLDSLVLLNRTNRFEPISLPLEAQLAPVFSLNVGDVDGDGLEDLFCSQNFFGTASDISRDDSGRGVWLRGLGTGRFQALPDEVSGVRVLGEQRGAALADFNHDGRVDLAIAQNGGPTQLYLNRRATQGLRVTLAGPAGNPDGVGAQLAVIYPGGRRGPVRVVQAGSGYLAQDAAAQVLGVAGPPEALWVRWPGGKEQTVALRNQEWNLRVSASP